MAKKHEDSLPSPADLRVEAAQNQLDALAKQEAEALEKQQAAQKDFQKAKADSDVSNEDVQKMQLVASPPAADMLVGGNIPSVKAGEDPNHSLPGLAMALPPETARGPSAEVPAGSSRSTPGCLCARCIQGLSHALLPFQR